MGPAESRNPNSLRPTTPVQAEVVVAQPGISQNNWVEGGVHYMKMDYFRVRIRKKSELPDQSSGLLATDGVRPRP